MVHTRWKKGWTQKSRVDGYGSLLRDFISVYNSRKLLYMLLLICDVILNPLGDEQPNLVDVLGSRFPIHTS